MTVIRFLFGTLLAAVAAYFFGGWALTQSEQQIGKMQLNAYNTPGAESPVPPAVIAAGFSTVGTLWMVQRRLLGMRGPAALLALLAGSAAGIAALVLPTRNGTL
jgi:hypothetical protein